MSGKGIDILIYNELIHCNSLWHILSIRVYLKILKINTLEFYVYI